MLDKSWPPLITHNLYAIFVYMKTYEQHKKEVFARRPDVKKTYDALGPEYALIERMVEKRLKEGLTQAKLAKKIGTKQSAVSRFESGIGNPTVAFLYKMADALDVKLKITVS